jgi:radical SAM superfamily enzyme YgiQ (UPF0313 family)
VGDAALVAHQLRIVAEAEREAIIEAGIELRWSAECRIDVLDEELLDVMRRAGCVVILVGIETGDEEVAERLGKSV